MTQPTKILIVTGPYNYGRSVKGLGDIVNDHDHFMEHPEEYKLLLFTGGSDVSPGLYNHSSPKGKCGSNPMRDMQEEAIFRHALKHKIKMTGICRGSQFLNVMNGGWMIHDLKNHAGVYHGMQTAAGKRIEVTSTHHQMSVVGKHGHVIGWSDERRSNIYYGDEDRLIDYDGPEVEAIWYPNTQCAAVQYHPEYMPEESDGYQWYYKLVTNLLTLSIDQFYDKYVISKDAMLSIQKNNRVKHAI